ncbi:MAG: hypothetical protein ABUT39_17950 [Acidobacteriota bacterium]
MKKLRIYIDTSVIGGCFDAEFSQWPNSLMQDFAAGTFIPIVSDVLAAEIQDAPEAVRQEYDHLISSEHELMLVTEAGAGLQAAADLLTAGSYEGGRRLARE